MRPLGGRKGEKGCDSMGSSFCAASASGEASGCVAVGDGEEEDMEEVEQRELKVSYGVAAIGLPGVAVEELAHAAFVFFGVVDVAHGVCRVGRDPQGFDARFGGIERVHHGGGHKVVVAAVDEEHRFPAAAHGFECRGLVERPTVAPFAQGGGGGNDGEGREAVAHARVRRQECTEV